MSRNGPKRLIRHVRSMPALGGAKQNPICSIRDFPSLADTVEKGFLRYWTATLIQDQEQTRNLDSRIDLLGFVRFNFQFHSSYAVTFSTVSTRRRHNPVIARQVLLLTRGESKQRTNAPHSVVWWQLE